MGRLTTAYATTADGICPVCERTAYLTLRGDDLLATCDSDCDESKLLAALDTDAVRAELRVTCDHEEEPPERGERSYAELIEAAQRPSRNGAGGRREIVAESFASIAAERTRWLWDRRIPLGCATLLVGREKLGKSTLTDELAARLSRGELPGDFAGEPAGTLIVSYEDSAARTIKPRLMAAGADLAHVHRTLAMSKGARDLVTLPDDVERIGELAVRYGVRLLVIDPLSAALNGKIDAHREQDMRRQALAPLAQLAEECDLAVLGLAHFNKARAGDLLSRVLGTRGLTAGVRSVLAFGRDPDADEDSVDRGSSTPPATTRRRRPRSPAGSRAERSRGRMARSSRPPGW